MRGGGRDGVSGKGMAAGETGGARQVRGGREKGRERGERETGGGVLI